MTTQLSFSVREDTDDFAHSGCLLSTQHSDLSTVFGTFSRDWAEEEELDELIDSLEAGRISHKQGLLRARKLLVVAAGANMQIFSRSGNADGFWASNAVFAASSGVNSGALQISTWPWAR